MNLLTQNTKLKRTSKQLGLRVFNFGIPAYKSASGKLTCPFADKAHTYGVMYNLHLKSAIKSPSNMTL